MFARGVLASICGLLASVSLGAAPVADAATALGAKTPHASPAGAGNAGYCTSANGVTVVVDFTDLDQPGDGRPDYGIVVRCVAKPVQNGVQALQLAGFSPEGTAQYGLAFVCRIGGRPAADEPLNRADDPGYTEQCQQTPPQSAYWEYWTAPNGGPWSFSASGAGSHHPIAGGFEGWSFSLNGSHHPPGVAPVRPGPTAPPSSSSPSPTTAPTSTPPPSGPKPSARPGNGAAPQAPWVAAHGGGSTNPTPRVKPAPRAKPAPQSMSIAPSAPHRVGSGAGVDRSHRDSGRRRTPQHRQRPSIPAVTTPARSTSPPSVSSSLPPRSAAASSSAPAGAPLAGFGLLALLAGGAGISAWRRSRRV
jgi:hypothetical protein